MPLPAIAAFAAFGLMLTVDASEDAAGESFDRFYTKTFDSDGIIIRASREVSDEAMHEADRRIHMMLEHLPTVRSNLVNADAEVHIIGKDQVTSDLPENSHLKGKPFDGKLTVDERTRGLGGLWTSCGEENLLRLAKDRYRGRDILVHEFTHNIFEHGVPADFRKRVKRQYDSSLAAGHWLKAYAATNPNEFFAEMAMWYFGTHGDLHMAGDKPKNGPEGLRAYDPEAFALLDDFYQGRIAVPEKKFKILPSHPEADASSLRSRDGGEPSTIIFRNQTRETLRLFWIGYDGKREPRGELLPHASQTHSTFSAHAWMWVDNADKPVALFVAEAGDCIAVIPPPASRP